MRTPFEYTAPESISEVHSLLDKYGSDAEILAGGTDLLVDVRNDVKSPRLVIDIKNIPDLQGIDYDPDSGLSIHACATCSDLTNSKAVQEHYSTIVEAASELASHQVRNRATAVGNVCNASPCADLARPLLCLGATTAISSSDEKRSVPLEDFFTGVKETVLAENEIVENIHVSAEMADQPGGTRKLKRIKGHDLSLASVTIVQTDTETRVAIGACGPTPVLLSNFPADADANDLCAAAEENISPIDDVRSTADYRKFMVKKYIRDLDKQIN